MNISGFGFGFIQPPKDSDIKIDSTRRTNPLNDLDFDRFCLTMGMAKSPKKKQMNLSYLRRFLSEG